MRKTTLLALGLLLTGIVKMADAQTTITVDTRKPGAPIQPTMYGIFFEDINYGADGGLYAEMIKNRSFEFPQRLMGWNSFGLVEVRNDGPFERNPHYVRLTWPGHDHKHTGLENEGFFGVSVKHDETYRFSVWARTPAMASNNRESIRIELVGADSEVLTRANLTIDSKEWKKYQVEMQAPRTDAKARLRLFLTSKGS
ncbi:MAG: carbohydrate binding domain-containing protein, partial [Bacteroidales bacterium]|nr:carbohydrate binding domain-containing protein [Bacteroidales bacterium]